MSHSHTVSTMQPNSRRHNRTLMFSLVAGLAIAVILLAHGADWWSAPVAVVAVVVLGHVVALGGLLALGSVMTRSSDRRDELPRGDLIHKPRLYDWMVGVLSGGRERRMRSAWLDLANLQTGEAVLDVGCGTGTLLLAASARLGPSGTLCGLEAAPEMAAHARDKAKRDGVEMEIATGSADALPYPDRSFDVVFSTLVFHHLPTDLQEAALTEIRRVLRPDGRVVIVDLPHDHGGHAPGGLGRLRSLISIVHSGPKGHVIDIEDTLASLGAREVTHHSAGINALLATRAIFP